MPAFKKVILFTLVLFCLTLNVSADNPKWRILWLIIPEIDAVVDGTHHQRRATDSTVNLFRTLAGHFQTDLQREVRLLGGTNVEFEVVVEVSSLPKTRVTGGDANSRFPTTGDIREILDLYAPLRQSQFDALVVTGEMSNIRRQWGAINLAWYSYCPFVNILGTNRMWYNLQLHEFAHTVERWWNGERQDRTDGLGFRLNGHANRRAASPDGADGIDAAHRGVWVNYIYDKYPEFDEQNRRRGEPFNARYQFEILGGSLPLHTDANGIQWGGIDQRIWSYGPSSMTPDVYFEYTNALGAVERVPYRRQGQEVGRDAKVIFVYRYDVQPQSGSNGFIFGLPGSGASAPGSLSGCCNNFAASNIVRNPNNRELTIDMARQRGGLLNHNEVYLIGTRLNAINDPIRNPTFDIWFRAVNIEVDVDNPEIRLRRAAREGGEYKMSADIRLTEVLEVQENFTLDLGGHNLTIEASTAAAIRVAQGKTLTVRDSEAGDNKLVARNSGPGAAINASAGTVIIESGTVEARGGNRGAGIGSSQYQHGGNIIIRGSANVSSEGGQFSSGLGAGADAGGMTVEISGGTVVAIGGQGSAGIGNGWGGERNITGTSRVTISGGTVVAIGQDGSGSNDIGSSPTGNHGAITVTGGSVHATRGRANPQPTNSTQNVYMVTLTLYGVNEITQVTEMTMPANYGTNNMFTDISGRLYVWIPAGANVPVSLTANGEVYSGVIENVATNNTTELTLRIGGPTSIRNNRPVTSNYGIILENAVVSDFARISVITPEPATANITILDNLGNVVFSADDVRAGLKPAPTADGAIIWNLTNKSGRFVANGTYLIIVEAKGVNGRRFAYQARLGVNR